MPARKIAVTVEETLLRTVDGWVAQGRYPNRSQAISTILREKSERWKRVRLTEELAKLDPDEEKAMAEERFAGETWPEY